MYKLITSFCTRSDLKQIILFFCLVQAIEWVQPFKLTIPFSLLQQRPLRCISLFSLVSHLIFPFPKLPFRPFPSLICLLLWFKTETLHKHQGTWTWGRESHFWLKSQIHIQHFFPPSHEHKLLNGHHVWRLNFIKRKWARQFLNYRRAYTDRFHYRT